MWSGRGSFQKIQRATPIFGVKKYLMDTSSTWPSFPPLSKKARGQEIQVCLWNIGFADFRLLCKMVFRALFFRVKLIFSFLKVWLLLPIIRSKELISWYLHRWTCRWRRLVKKSHRLVHRGMKFDNFWVINLGIRNHADKKGSFVLQSFAVFSLHPLNHILSFLFQIFFIKNFCIIGSFFSL